ncbi:uncharacterized protein METZ01_LOCUS347152 [marine metagenome]|uniref:Uncharacterized protein n=1 Tax=marine metagenome TaxID=408172 RepID=A0A382RBB7_9ZZZZ
MSPAKPPSSPFDLTTRWQGTIGANGFLFIALPTARCALGRPIISARPPYEITFPGGTFFSAS